MNKATIIILVFVSACAATNKMAPTMENLSAMKQKVPAITLERANQGYALYKSKCAGCHRLHMPSEYTIPKWKMILPEMYVKSKLNIEAEKALIRDYLYALSK